MVQKFLNGSCASGLPLLLIRLLLLLFLLLLLLLRAQATCDLSVAGFSGNDRLVGMGRHGVLLRPGRSHGARGCTRSETIYRGQKWQHRL
mgnify:CR=1 FL=1